jgi:hypothetical protein
MPRQALAGEATGFSFMLTGKEDPESSEHPAIFHGPSKEGSEP